MRLRLINNARYIFMFIWIANVFRSFCCCYLNLRFGPKALESAFFGRYMFVSFVNFLLNSDR